LVASCDKSKTDAGTGKKPGPASVLGQITRFFDVVAFLAAFGDGGPDRAPIEEENKLISWVDSIVCLENTVHGQPAVNALRNSLTSKKSKFPSPVKSAIGSSAR